MTLPTRAKYAGESRRLLLAFDIGTTFSGISYSILDPGKVPEINPVTRYPDQEHVGGDNKIPTVVYYDSAGQPRAIGAATLKDGVEADAEENGWIKAYWFKLHLRPLADRREDDQIPSLPPNKSVIQVFTDYMRYLYQCSKTYISDTHGAKLWQSLEGNIMFVLTHPNGWGGKQQAQMRNAAVLAGLVPDAAHGLSRVSFVTEGEASLHFCLSSGLVVEGHDDNSGVLIVDAGGGTIDVTTYRKLSTGTYEEIAIPKCYFQGAIYVTTRAEDHFQDLLSGTRFEQDIPMLKTRFDRNTKHVFRTDNEPLHIQFASHRERDEALKIRGGRLTLTGKTVAKFFEPSVSCIVAAIKTQRSTAHFPIKSVFLVGGFSASNWLYEQVREAIEPLGVTVSRPDTHVNKAVSNGGVSFFLDGVVKSRVAQMTYGARYCVYFNRKNKDHLQRAHLVYIDPVTGKNMLEGAFDCTLPKDTRVEETKEFRRSFCRDSTDSSELDSVTTHILSYTGGLAKPNWVIDEPKKFPTMCIVKADTSAVKRTRGKSELTGEAYYEITFEIVLLFGLAELKAQIAYQEDGVEKRGPAAIVY